MIDVFKLAATCFTGFCFHPKGGVVILRTGKCPMIGWPCVFLCYWLRRCRGSGLHMCLTTHTHTHTYTVSGWLSLSQTLSCEIISLSLLHKHTEVVGGECDFIWSIFSSGDDRRTKSERHTPQRCGFGVSGGVFVRLTSSYSRFNTLMKDTMRWRKSGYKLSRGG